MLKRMIALLLMLLLQPTQPAAAELVMVPSEQVPLAVDVFNAHGGEQWHTVETIKFTFHVEADGEERLAAEHVWNVPAGEATVTWNDQTQTTNTTTGDGEAFGRWTNDAYWLVAPLKLLDAGVEAVELKPMQDGTRQLLVGFVDVGMTPGDKYLYEIDPGTKLVKAWTFMPNDETKRRFEWTGYEQFGPLMLSLDHTADEGFRVYFTDVDVITTNSR